MSIPLLTPKAGYLLLRNANSSSFNLIRDQSLITSGGGGGGCYKMVGGDGVCKVLPVQNRGQKKF